TGKHIQRDRWVGVPAVLLRNRDELSPCTGTIHADALRVWTKMTASCKAIAAVSARDVTLTDDQVAFCKTFYVIAYQIDNADKLMANDHRHPNHLLRPSVPVVDVQVRATYGCFQHSDQHVIAADFW